MKKSLLLSFALTIATTLFSCGEDETLKEAIDQQGQTYTNNVNVDIQDLSGVSQDNTRIVRINDGQVEVLSETSAQVQVGDSIQIRALAITGTAQVPYVLKYTLGYRLATGNQNIVYEDYTVENSLTADNLILTAFRVKAKQ